MDTLYDALIFIVDDDVVSIDMMQAVLAKKGFKSIVSFADAREGLEAAFREKPDLIILDIVMPDMDGFSFCEQLKGRRETADIPVIMVTGGALEREETIERTFEAGSFDFITKPVNATELHTRCRSALTLKKAHDRLKEEVETRRQAEQELRAAFERIKKLSGLLPICASCKKIRDDQGYWQNLERYIHEHSDAQFSHSLCPECAQRLYPDLSDE